MSNSSFTIFITSRLESSVEQLRVLNQIAVSSGKASDIDQILNLIVQKSIDAIKAEQGSILLVTKDKDKPVKTFVRQDDTSRLQHNYHIGTNISGWVLKNKQPLIIENLSEDKRFIPTEDEKKEIKSVLCVPIWFEGEIIGLMMLINKKNQKQFSMDDLTLFSIISVQAGQLIKNLELQRKSFQERKESEKLQELDRLKSNFFTNISHEFKTPLTLILGPAKQILEQSEISQLKEQAETIYRNGSKLRELTNQIMELSKIEAGQLKLKVTEGNLVPFIKEIVASFQSLAEVKKILLKFKPPEEKVIVYIDRDKIEKIIYNLLSNAIKFTPEGGSVNVGIRSNTNQNLSGQKGNNLEDEGFIEISVSDTGIGIPEEDIDKIFNRFYRAVADNSIEYEGTGIGLSLTKELVELHKGRIFVESEVREGSTFKIFLPKGKTSYSESEIAEQIKIDKDKKNTAENDEFHGNSADLELISYKSSDASDSDKINKYVIETDDSPDKPILLIVEDNHEVRNYIINILTADYNIIEAKDGKGGMLQAFEQIPHLIISDIMMPGIDGLQLCSQLKSDTRTSHIPIILLTAKSGLPDKIEGLETGADDYIMKPFEAAELKARIKNLLEQRKRIHEHFRKHGLLFDDTNITSLDQRFLQQAFNSIDKNFTDSNFSVKKMANELALSRSLLHKKLIALVGESPSDLIRRIRLNKAAKLIEQKAYNISEIAFEVGFNNPSYFAKCFLNQFGFSPSQYHQNIKNNQQS